MFPFSGSMTMFFTAGSSPPFEDISDAMRKGDWVGLMGLGSIFFVAFFGREGMKVAKEMSKECICPWTTGQNLLTWLHSGPKVDAVCKSNSGSTLQYVTHFTDGSLS